MQLLKDEEERLKKAIEERRAKAKLKDAEIITVNSTTNLATIRSTNVEAFKPGRGKGSLVLKGRQGINPFKRNFRR